MSKKKKRNPLAPTYKDLMGKGNRVIALGDIIEYGKNAELIKPYIDSFLDEVDSYILANIGNDKINPMDLHYLSKASSLLANSIEYAIQQGRQKEKVVANNGH